MTKVSLYFSRTMIELGEYRARIGCFLPGRGRRWKSACLTAWILHQLIKVSTHHPGGGPGGVYCTVTEPAEAAGGSQPVSPPGSCIS